MHNEALLRCLKQRGKFKLKGLLNICLCTRQILTLRAFKRLFMRAIHFSSKIRPSAYRSVTEMVFTQEMQRVDRELHLELAESPINPAFIHVFTYSKWLRSLILPQNVP